MSLQLLMHLFVTNIFMRYERYYSDSNFWDKVKNVAKKVGKELIYNALLLYYVLYTRLRYETSIHYYKRRTCRKRFRT